MPSSRAESHREFLYDLHTREKQHKKRIVSAGLIPKPTPPRPESRRGYAHRGPNGITDAVDYAKFFSRSHDALIRVYDEGDNVIETHEQKGESSTHTTFGSTLTITGERNVP